MFAEVWTSELSQCLDMGHARRDMPETGRIVVFRHGACADSGGQGLSGWCEEEAGHSAQGGAGVDSCT